MLFFLVLLLVVFVVVVIIVTISTGRAVCTAAALTAITAPVHNFIMNLNCLFKTGEQQKLQRQQTARREKKTQPKRSHRITAKNHCYARNSIQNVRSLKLSLLHKHTYSICFDRFGSFVYTRVRVCVAVLFLFFFLFHFLLVSCSTLHF